MIERGATEGEETVREAATESTGNEVGTGIAIVNVIVIVKGNAIVIATGNVTTAKLIPERDRAAGTEIANVKENANTGNEAGRKGEHDFFHTNRTLCFLDVEQIPNFGDYNTNKSDEITISKIIIKILYFNLRFLCRRNVFSK